MTKAYVSHVEWCCRDIEKTARFLQALFSWDFKPFGNNYLLSHPSQGPAVGLLRGEQTVQGNNCLAFISVDDIDTYLQRASTLGGSIFVEKTAIPDYGWYAQIQDLEGNIVGLFEPLR